MQRIMEQRRRQGRAAFGIRFLGEASDHQCPASGGLLVLGNQPRVIKAQAHQKGWRLRSKGRLGVETPRLALIVGLKQSRL
jgi:hypothetical protein